MPSSSYSTYSTQPVRTHTSIVFKHAGDDVTALRAHGGLQVVAEGLQLRRIDGAGDYEWTACVTSDVR